MAATEAATPEVLGPKTVFGKWMAACDDFGRHSMEARFSEMACAHGNDFGEPVDGGTFFRCGQPATGGRKSHRHFAPPRIRCVQDPLREPVPLFPRRQCDRTLERERRQVGPEVGPTSAFTAVFPQEFMGQLSSFGPT